jgi:molybdate transport system ATP-binding protein
MSSGEQKKALLNFLLKSKPDFIILDNPFDNLDSDAQADLRKTLKDISASTILIQIISRTMDVLPFITHFAELQKTELHILQDSHLRPRLRFNLDRTLPEPLEKIDFRANCLIQLKNSTVAYGPKPVLKNINWTIRKGDFWQLVGKNGSGKTTLLSMITGENPKGYGQELFIFGKQKGSGESIWDIKKKIGYFTPAMTDKFNGYHTVEHMLISGLFDSIGLYIRPSESQLRLAKEWLLLIGLWDFKDTLFSDLTLGQQRLVMTTRAMVKHPLLLILDEPTAGLDDVSAGLVVALVNKIAAESETAILFVSHRKEPGLHPTYIFELKMSKTGSTGHVRDGSK